MRAFKDGNAWCIVPDNFYDLVESPTYWIDAEDVDGTASILAIVAEDKAHRTKELIKSVSIALAAAGVYGITQAQYLIAGGLVLAAVLVWLAARRVKST